MTTHAQATLRALRLRNKLRCLKVRAPRENILPRFHAAVTFELETTRLDHYAGAHAAFAFTSGMAALSTVTRLLKTNDTLLLGSDIYGGMHRLVSRVTSALHGIKIKFVDTTDLQTVAAALDADPSITMLHMETPSNPLMRVTPIRQLADLLHSRKVLLCVDGTMMSPILQQPLQLGADIVVHSATKFFGGHSDVTGGLVCVGEEELAKRIAFFQNAEGSGLAPFDCWLFLRGIKTLALRVEKAQQNAITVAKYLREHKLVHKLNFAGLEPLDKRDTAAWQAFEIHKSQASGPGVVLSFTTGSVAISRRFIDALRIFKLTVSFGSVNSLCEMPCVLSHASIPAAQRTLPDDLIRLSIGIEDVNDLLHDIEQAFDLAGNATVVNVRAVRRRGSSVGNGLSADSASAGTAKVGSGGTNGSPAAANGVARANRTHLSDTADNKRDAAKVALDEVCRLRETVSILSARLATAEASNAALEAARRLGGGQQGANRSTASQSNQVLSAASVYSDTQASAANASAGLMAATPVGVVVASVLTTIAVVAIWYGAHRRR
jgi:cystathionine beta-lyase/cystathionine gamma-synthase